MKNIRKYLFIGIVALTAVLTASCGEEDRCFTCTLNATVVDVCTDNYQEQAALGNLDVDSLDEYLEEVRRTGFDSVQIQ